MSQEQSNLYEFLTPADAGTPGKALRYVHLTRTEAWILRQLSENGAMLTSELMESKPKNWAASSIRGRLAEMSAREPKLIVKRKVEIEGGTVSFDVRGNYIYSITREGRAALRGLPVDGGEPARYNPLDE